MQVAAAMWRKYPPAPAGCVEHCADRTTVRALQGINLNEKARKKSLEQQRERARLTGFAGGMSEVGHAVVWELRRRGVPRSYALFGGHLASVSSEWNYQGNKRLSRWIGFSDRTARRARAMLEERKLIRSHLLLTGDQLQGQKAPVKRPQVVRNVAALQRLAAVRNPRPDLRTAHRTPRQGATGTTDRPVAPRQPTAAERPVEPTSAEHFEQLARMHPMFAGPLGVLAAVQRKRTANSPVAPQAVPPTVPPAPSPEEIDAWDAETERLEREGFQHDPDDDDEPPD